MEATSDADADDRLWQAIVDLREKLIRLEIGDLDTDVESLLGPLVGITGATCNRAGWLCDRMLWEWYGVGIALRGEVEWLAVTGKPIEALIGRIRKQLAPLFAALAYIRHEVEV